MGLDFEGLLGNIRENPFLGKGFRGCFTGAVISKERGFWEGFLSPAPRGESSHDFQFRKEDSCGMRWEELLTGEGVVAKGGRS